MDSIIHLKMKTKILKISFLDIKSVTNQIKLKKKNMLNINLSSNFKFYLKHS